MKKFCFAVATWLLVSGFYDYQPLSSWGVTETQGLQVELQLGGDGIRGGGSLLLLVELNNGTKRKFDLNRTRQEWGGNSRQALELVVEPPIQYAMITNIGLEFHGSQGDLLQEQDDFDLASLSVFSVARGSSSHHINGNRVKVYLSQTVYRFDNDQTRWFGRVNPMIEIDNMCSADRDCDDGNYCNGAEKCAPHHASSDARGCLVQPAPCVVGQFCNEAADRCETQCVDNDGDGHLASHCGGDDCDDNDPNRYPGNVEVHDSQDHDEDCDVNTHGIFQGFSSTQICDGPSQVVLVNAREEFVRQPCITGTVCILQPNGTGICATQPEGYQPPAAATLPTGPQAQPPQPLSRLLGNKNIKIPLPTDKKGKKP